MHISTVNISQTMTDSSNITNVPNIMLHVDFRLTYLVLIMIDFKGQLDSRNGIVTFLSKITDN